jgi:hypothetical protein
MTISESHFIISLQDFFVLHCHGSDLEIQTVGGGNGNPNLQRTVRQFEKK